MKIIIIGGSHGGFTAINAILEQYPNAQIEIVEQNSFEFEIPSSVKVWNPAIATQLFPATHTLNIRQNNQNITLTYDKLIIATGGKAFLPSFPGKNLPEVSIIHTRDQVNKIQKIVTNPLIKNVILVGAGYIGIGLADLLSKHGKSVTVIDNAPQILNTYLDQSFTSQIEQDLVSSGINFRLGERVEKINGDNHVNAVNTNSGSYPADFVFVNVGVRPNTSWLSSAINISTKGFIQVNNFMETSAPDIFAIGDAVNVCYRPLNQVVGVSLASNAQRQAEIAALNLTSHRITYQGVYGTSIWQAGKYTFSSTGLTQETAHSANIKVSSATVKQKIKNNEVQVKLIYSPNETILGAQILADTPTPNLINVIAIALQNQMQLSDLAQSDFYLSPAVSRLPNILNEVAFTALRKKYQV